MNAGTLAERRNAALARNHELITAAKSANRKLNAEEEVRFSNDMREASLLSASLATTDAPVARQSHLAALRPIVDGIRAILNRQPIPDGLQRTPDGGILIPSIRADISESGDGSGIIPLPSIARTEAVVAAPSLDRAGATIIGGEIPFGEAALSQGVVFVVPSATPPTQESEGDGADSSNDPSIYTVRTGVPPITDDLNKISIEFFQDAQPVVQAGLVSNLQQNLRYAVDASFVSTLVTDVATSNPIGSYGDLFTAALEAIAGVHSAFNNGTCCWLGGRQARKAFANVRNSFNQPIFTPASATQEMDSLLGYPFILSEAAGSDALFGNFSRAVTIVRTGTWLQVLRELYAEDNQFGLKVLCRAAMKSYPSVVPAGKPQPLSVVHTQQGSS